jgi:predicted metal-binding membrane protein
MHAVIAGAARIEKGIQGRSGEARRSRRASRRAFFGASALLFAAAATGTILWCASMSTMGEMPMAGGWSMSMLWMRMPEQTWAGAGAAFIGMWTAMMIAMMLPSLAPTLWRDVGAETRAGRLAALIGAGYFSVWIALGIAVFLLGVVLAAVEMQEPELARAVPIMAGVVVLGAGVLQFTPWKARHLAICRKLPCSFEASRGRKTLGHRRVLPANPVGAWQCGLRLGFHCCLASAGSTAILLVIGMMDLRTMAAVTAAITAERLAPASQRVVWTIGAVAVGAGLFLIISSV